MTYSVSCSSSLSNNYLTTPSVLYKIFICIRKKETEREKKIGHYRNRVSEDNFKNTIHLKLFGLIMGII